VRRDRRGEFGRTLLHIACNNGKRYDYIADGSKAAIRSYKTAHILLQAGADPNASDQDGNGPLHALVGFYSKEVESSARLLLLEFGAHQNRANRNGKTALDVWIAAGRSGVSDWYDIEVNTLTCLIASCCCAFAVLFMLLF